MVTALVNSKMPRPALACRNGAEGTNPLANDRRTVPVAISVAGGVVRTHLTVVGEDRGPGIEVPRRVDVTQLAEALDAILNGTLPEGEVSAFYAVTAAAFAQGIDHERTTAGVA